VTAGIKVDASALLSSPKHLLLIPLLVVGMLLARGIASLSLFSPFDLRQARGAALLAATNLSFMVITANVGNQLGLVDPATAAAMVISGVVSVLLFPPTAVALLPGHESLDADWDEQGAT
jgi:Kef-type K+ transport system membrane component KefB